MATSKQRDEHPEDVQQRLSRAIAQADATLAGLQKHRAQLRHVAWEMMRSKRELLDRLIKSGAPAGEVVAVYNEIARLKRLAQAVDDDQMV